MTDQEFVKVSRQVFQRVKEKQAYCTAHTVMICEPPITFFWNYEVEPDEDWSFGQKSFGKIVRDHDLKPPYTDKPEYYLRKDILDADRES